MLDKHASNLQLKQGDTDSGTELAKYVAQVRLSDTFSTMTRIMTYVTGQCAHDGTDMSGSLDYSSSSSTFVTCASFQTCASFSSIIDSWDDHPPSYHETMTITSSGTTSANARTVSTRPSASSKGPSVCDAPPHHEPPERRKTWRRCFTCCCRSDAADSEDTL